MDKSQEGKACPEFAEGETFTPAHLLTRSPAPVPPEMSAQEYEIWRALIEQRCGLHFSPGRLVFLRRRLWDRMRQCGIQSYSDYYHHVAFNSAGEDEWGELLELLLNNESGFFRHLPSFDALTGYVLPQLRRNKQAQGINTINMWSAGCSTGRETYSMAMAYLETERPPSPPPPQPFGFAQDRRGEKSEQSSPLWGARGAFPPTVQPGEPGDGGEEEPDKWQVKILGSDISQCNLARARKGQYKSYEVRHTPRRYRQTYITVSQNGAGKQNIYRVSNKVRALVEFNYINFHDPNTYPPPVARYSQTGQDVIFCQNVLIYFNAENRLKIVRQLCQRLNVGGYLFLAPAEVVGLKLPGIQPVRLTDVLIYQRVK